MSGVKVKAVDRRTIELTFPVPVADLAAALEGTSGYSVTDASVFETGQRDSIATGLRLVLTREGEPKPLDVKAKPLTPRHAERSDFHPSCYRG